VPEIDPVILQLKADNDKYLSELRRTTQTADQQLGLQEKRVKSLERQMASSSGRIGASLRGLAGTLATYFTGRELVGLLDSFTRLQNNLRVAGLEGDALARVQQSLLDISQRYGTEIEGLTSVFLKASLAQKELGASTGDIIRLNEIVAASLKVTGTSAAQAQGALLQLGQALGSGVVRAEEFNSILEGALPLAQAAARGIDGMGGSVAKLRAEIAEGNVTSQQFFQGVLKGGVQTLADAEKATLTLAGGFTALTSALTVYFGEADKANGVSAALGTTLSTLADNLDVLIPAIAAVATGLGVGFVTNAVRARLAAAALAAQAAGTATSMGGLALAARGAGAALLSAFGGSVGVAILAIGAAIYYAYQQTQQAERATGVYAKTQQVAQKATEAAAQAAERLASAHGQAREEALALARAEQENIKQKLASARASQALAQAELARATARYNSMQAEATAAAIGGGEGGAIAASQMRGGGEAERRQAAINLKTQIQNVRDLQAALKTIDTAITSVPTPPVTAPVKPERPKTTPKQTGPTAAEIAERHAQELARLNQEELQAKIQLTDDVRDRADLERDLLAAEFAEREAQIRNDKDFTADQKKAQIAALERLYGVARSANGEIVVSGPGLYQQKATAELEEALADAQREALRQQHDQMALEADALRARADIADTLEQRRFLENSALAIQQEIERSLLEQAIAEGKVADAAAARAALAERQSAETTGQEKRNQGALGRYLDDTADPRQRAEEAAVREMQAVRDGLVEGIASSLGTKNQFVKDALTIFLDEAIFRPLAESLRGAGGEGGLLSGLFSAVGSIFTGGRASGGRVNAGQIYRINEGASPGQVEGFRPDVGGQIIPLGRMKAARSGGTMINQTVNVDARGVNPQGFADHIRAAVRQETMELVTKSSQMTLKAAPGEVQRAQRYGR
jgi:tape measure domain-containing protein